MGNPKVSTVGGGPATGLADEFTQWLQQGLITGQFGGSSPGAAYGAADPYASTRQKARDMAGKGGWQGELAQKALAKLPPLPSANPQAGLTGILNNILSGGAGTLGESMQKIITQKQAEDVSNLRARYSIGGTGAGTPAAYGESLYRAQAAPQAAMQIGQLQLQTLLPLLQMIMGISGKGIPQASTLVAPSGFSQFMSGLGGLATGAGSLMSGYGAMKGAGAAAA